MKKLLGLVLLLALSIPAFAVVGAVKDAGWVGAYTAGATVNIDFTTYDATAGTATALAGTPKADVYCNGSATPTATNITITASLNSVVGFNTVAIDTTGYAAGKCTAVISAGTVTTSVVGFRIGNFTVGTPQSADIHAVNGGSTGSTAGQLELSRIKVIPSGGSGPAIEVDAASGGSGGEGVYIKGVTPWAAMRIEAATGNYGLDIDGGVSSGNNGIGLTISGGPNHPAVRIQRGAGNELNLVDSDGSAMTLTPVGAGKAINAQGQILVQPTNTDDDAVALVGNGAGSGLSATTSTGNAVTFFAPIGSFGLVIDNNTSQVIFANGNTALSLTATSDGKAINALGQIYVAPSNAGDDAVELVGAASGGGDPGAALSLLGGPTNGGGNGGLGLKVKGGDGLDNFGGTAAEFRGGNGGLGPLLGISIVGSTGVIIAGDNTEVDIAGNGSDADALRLASTGSGKAINAQGQISIVSVDDIGLYIESQSGDSNKPAVQFLQSNGADALDLIAGGGHGISVSAGGDGLILNTGGQAIRATAGTDQDVIYLGAAGSGKAINALGQVSIAPTNPGDAAVDIAGAPGSDSVAGGKGLRISNGADNGAGSDVAVLITTGSTGYNALELDADNGGNGAFALAANGPAYFNGSTVSPGLSLNGSPGLLVTGVTDQDAITLTPAGSGKAVNAQGQVSIIPTYGSDDAVFIDASGTDGYGFHVIGDSAVQFEGANGGTGLAVFGDGGGGSIYLQGGSSNSDVVSVVAAGGSNGNSLTLFPDGTGVGLKGSGFRLQKATSFAHFPFVMYSATTGLPLAGLTVTCTVSLDGGAFAACTNSPAGISAGAYKVDLDGSTDLNGDAVILKFTATGAKTQLIPVLTER